MGKDLEQRTLSFVVSFRGQPYKFSLPRDDLLAELAANLEFETGALVRTQKLLVPRSGGPKKPAVGLQLSDDAIRKLTIDDAGIQEGQELRLVGATASELQALVPPPADKVLGFEEEAKRARLRRQQVATDLAAQLPKGPYTFHGFRTIEIPGIQLTPPPARALTIMHRLATDPGIVAVMVKHRWAVGIMTELPPVGYVGVSPKCLLGFNKNRGEEISLRLRTDDLRGFRKYDSIRKTLLHELVHMVHDDHDIHFKTLNSQLNREAEELDWTRSAAHTLDSQASLRAASWHDEDMEEEDDWDEDSVMVVTGRSSGQALGGRATPTISVREAAAEAALRRITAQETEHASATGSSRGPSAIDGLASNSGVTVVDVVTDEGTAVTPEAGRNCGSEGPAAESDPAAVEEKSAGGNAGNEVGREPMDVDLAAGGVMRDCTLNEQEAGSPDTVGRQDACQVDYESHPATATPSFQCLPDVPILTTGGSSAPDTKWQGSSRQGDVYGNEQMAERVGQIRVGAAEDRRDSQELSHADAEVPLDEEMARVQEASSAVGARIEQAVDSLRREAGEAGGQVALQTLTTILRNAISQPGVGKFRRLRKDNPQFQNRVGKYPAAQEILHTAGFRDQGHDTAHDGATLVLERDDPGLLWLALASLERAST